MNAVKSVEVRRDPRVSPAVAAVCVAAILWALALQQRRLRDQIPGRADIVRDVPRHSAAGSPSPVEP